MVNFNYDNTNYSINIYDSLSTMLEREDLVQLPMKAWKELFIVKDGICFSHLLLRVLEEKIKLFGKEANAVIYQENKYKINKVDRISLTNLLNANPKEFFLILGENSIPMEVNEAKKFLQELEIQSGKCFYVTHEHLNNLKTLRTEEQIINYDYTSNYPKNIILQ